MDNLNKNKLIVYDKRINNIFYKNNIQDSLIKIILDFMYYNYYNFINKKWNKLNEIDCIFYTKNTNHLEILKNVIKKVDSEKKIKIISEILPYSITENNINIFNILENNIINIKNSSVEYKSNYNKYKDKSYNFYYLLRKNYNLCIKLERKKFIKYFKKIKNWYISYYNRKELMYSYN